MASGHVGLAVRAQLGASERSSHGMIRERYFHKIIPMIEEYRGFLQHAAATDSLAKLLKENQEARVIIAKANERYPQGRLGESSSG
jgi:hypothetical protein